MSGGVPVESLSLDHQRFLSDLAAGGAGDTNPSLSHDVGVFRHESRSYTSMSWAAAHGNLDAVHALLPSHSTVKSTSNTALHEACRLGHVTLVNVLIGSGRFAPDALDDDGLGGVHYAAQAGSVPVLQLLRTVGADTALFSTPGLMPAHYAANAGHLKALQFLLDQGVSERRPDRTPQRWTVLHRAARYGHVPLCRYLTIRALVDVDECDAAGHTAAEIAARHEQHAVVAFFESMGRRGAVSDRSETTERKAAGRVPAAADTLSAMSKELAHIRTLHLRQVMRLEDVIADRERTAGELQHSLGTMQSKIERQRDEIDMLRAEIRHYQSGDGGSGRKHGRTGSGTSEGRYTRVRDPGSSSHCLKVDKTPPLPHLTDRFHSQ